MNQARYIFPMKVMDWSTLKTANGDQVTAGSRMNAIGFIPVYDSIAAMVDDHGNEIDSGTFVATEHVHDWRRSIDGGTETCDCGAWR